MSLSLGAAMRVPKHALQQLEQVQEQL